MLLDIILEILNVQESLTYINYLEVWKGLRELLLMKMHEIANKTFCRNREINHGNACFSNAAEKANMWVVLPKQISID